MAEVKWLCLQSECCLFNSYTILISIHCHVFSEFNLISLRYRYFNWGLRSTREILIYHVGIWRRHPQPCWKIFCGCLPIKTTNTWWFWTTNLSTVWYNRAASGWSLTHCNMMHGTHNVTLTHCNMVHGTHNVTLNYFIKAGAVTECYTSL